MCVCIYICIFDGDIVPGEAHFRIPVLVLKEGRSIPLTYSSSPMIRT